ncbi:MAG: DMT family transporter [Alphaproteobacteria bacterium]
MDLSGAPRGPGTGRGAAESTALGVLLALAAVLIWGGYFVAGRAAALDGIDPFDLTVLRIGVSGIVLAPLAWRRRRALPPLRAALFVIVGGAPYVLLSLASLAFAPASHAAVLQPGTVPLFAAVFGALWLGERVDAGRAVGLALCVAGVVAVGWHGLSGTGAGHWYGYAMFVIGGVCWALFTVAARAWRVDAWAVTALLSTWSAILFLPPYFLVFGDRLLDLPWRAIVFNGIYQGLLTGVLALAAWSRAVALLGAARCGAFTALVPCIAAVLAVPVLGEDLGLPEVAGIAAVAAGILVTLRIGARSAQDSPRAAVRGRLGDTR